MALTNAQIEHALKLKAGNIAAAAREMGVSRSTLNRRIAGSPGLREFVYDAREELVDIAESALKREVLGGNITAIIFTLKTQGKQRGYVERVENINLNVDTALVKQAIEAMEAAGLNASDVFNDIIREASELQDVRTGDSPQDTLAG